MEKTEWDNRYKLLLGRFQLDTSGKCFTMRKIFVIISSPGKWWISYCTLLQSSCTGCWAILYRPCFCQERLDQVILEVPSNLVFYSSVNSGKTPLSFTRDFEHVNYTGLDSLVQGFCFVFFKQTVVQRIFVLVVLNVHSVVFSSPVFLVCSRMQ